MQAPITPEEPEEPETNVLYDASKKAITKWDYGTEFTSTTEMDAYYGNLWKITLAGEGAEQSFQNEAISTRNFVKVYFYVYNPLAVETRLVVHGGWSAWARVTVMLAAQGWTKVEVDASVFKEDTAGQIFIVLQEVDGKSLAGEWKISSFYGLLDGEKAPEVQVPVTNVLVDASKQLLTKWDYGTEFAIESGVDAEYGNVWNITLTGEGAEQSFQNPAIDTTGVEKVSFYVYNPLAVEARLVVHGGWNAWARVTVMLAAQGWTKVEVDASVFNEDTAGQIFIVIQEVDGKSLAGEWKISSFCKA